MRNDREFSIYFVRYTERHGMRLIFELERNVRSKQGHVGIIQADLPMECCKDTADTLSQDGMINPRSTFAGRARMEEMIARVRNDLVAAVVDPPRRTVVCIHYPSQQEDFWADDVVSKS